MKKFTTLLFLSCIGLLGWSQNLTIVDFTGYNSSNLSTISPGWYEANTVSSPSGTSSSWVRDDYANVGANGDAAKINLYTTGKDEWIVSPSFLANSNSVLEFDLALTNYAATTAGNFDSDDTLEVRYSLDNGTTWAALATWTVLSAPISNIGQHEILSLAGFANQNLIIAFYATEGATSGTEDIDLFIDNIEINNPLVTDLSVTQILSPSGAGCFGGLDTIEVEIMNTGLNPLDFSSSSAFMEVEILWPNIGVTLAPAALFQIGVLAPGATQVIKVSNLLNTFTNPGTYTMTAYVTFPGDPAASNDTATSTATILPTIVAPFTEDFETAISGNPGTFPSGWIMLNPGGFRWQVESDGATNSSNTGPLDDHTSGGTQYVYTEATSSGPPTELISPCIDISNLSAPKLQFWYHMYGATMGTLNIDVVAGGVRTPLDSIVGQQQTGENDPWLADTLDLGAFVGQTIQIIFKGTKGTSFTGDISLDDISVFEILADDISASGGTVDYSSCSNADSATVSIDITNNGTNPAAGIAAAFSVDGGAPTTPELVPGILAPGASMTYTFTALADVSTPGAHVVAAGATIPADQFLGNNVDSIAVFNSTISAPFVEDFEGATVGSPGIFPAGWTIASTSSSSASSAGWHVESDGTTNSSGTGPLDDHTDGGSQYVFTETSSGSQGDLFTLTSPCIDLSAVPDPTLSFWYHMFGGDMGTLRVGVISASGQVLIDSLVGQQQTGENEPWLERIVDLSAYQGQTIELVFIGNREGSYEGDMSLDDISVFQPPASDLTVIGTNIGASACALDSATVIEIDVTNLGTDTVQTGAAQLSVDGNPYSAPETITGPIAPGAVVTFTFATTANMASLGAHTFSVIATATMAPDERTSNDTLMQSVNNNPSITPVFPYQEDFEGANLWTSGGANSSWELSTPGNTIINSAASGALSWVTGDSSLYNSNENSWVSSPCMDMTNAPANSWVSMKIWWEAETSWDGANLQSSSDGGATWDLVGAIGDPNNWYNDGTINGNPGGSGIGWTGRNGSGSDAWVLAAHPLDASLIGNANVRFRVNFGSDGSGQDEGFAFDDFTISEPPVVNIGGDSVTVCGTGTLDAGNPGMEYAWSTGDSTQTVSLLNTTAADILDSMIIVTVTDTFGLSTSDTIHVTIPVSTPDAVASVVSDASCFGDANGSAMVTVTGGTMPTLLAWNTNPPQSTEIATGLAAGTYMVTVVDSFGCSATDSVMITEPMLLEVSVDSVIDVLCAGDANGGINISATGGTGAYSYNWENGPMTQNLTGLTAGNYVGIVTDENGCSVFTPITAVSGPDSLGVAAQIMDNVCADDSTGSIDVTVSGGTAPFSFMWSNGETTEDLSGLANGSYTGIITDANGCELTSPALDIFNTDSMPTASFDHMPVGVDYSVDFTSATPNGTSYAWDFGDSTTSTDPNPNHVYASNDSYVVTLVVTNDCGSVTVTDTVSVAQVGIEDDLLSQNIKMFPNPNTGTFEINFDQLDLEDVSVRVFSMDGKRVYEKELGNINGFFSHQVMLPSSLAKGIYMLDIQTEKAALRKRFILE